MYSRWLFNSYSCVCCSSKLAVVHQKLGIRGMPTLLKLLVSRWCMAVVCCMGILFYVRHTAVLVHVCIVSRKLVLLHMCAQT